MGSYISKATNVFFSENTEVTFCHKRNSYKISKNGVIDESESHVLRPEWVEGNPDLWQEVQFTEVKNNEARIEWKVDDRSDIQKVFSDHPDCERPPLGITPQFIWKEHRIKELQNAIERNAFFGCEELIDEWIEHANWLMNRKKPGASK